MTVTIPSANDTGVPTTTAVRQLADGGTNTRGTVTLTQGATSTVVSDLKAGAGIMVVCTPVTAAAAALGTPWLSSADKGTFTLSHPSAPAGCTYDYEIRR